MERLRQRAQQLHAQHTAPAQDLETIVMLGGFAVHSRGIALENLDKAMKTRLKVLEMHRQRPLQKRLDAVIGALEKASDNAQSYAMWRDGLQALTSLGVVAGGVMTLAATGPVAAAVSLFSSAVGCGSSWRTQTKLGSCVAEAQKAWASFMDMGTKIREAVEAHQLASAAWLAVTTEQADHLEYILRIYTATFLDVQALGNTSPEPLDVYLEMLNRFNFDGSSPPITIVPPSSRGDGSLGREEKSWLEALEKPAAAVGLLHRCAVVPAALEISKLQGVADLARTEMHGWLRDVRQLQTEIADLTMEMNSATADGGLALSLLEHDDGSISLFTETVSEGGGYKTTDILQREEFLEYAQNGATKCRADIAAAEQGQKTASGNVLGGVGKVLLVASIAFETYKGVSAALSWKDGSSFPAREILQQWRTEMKGASGAFQMVDDLCKRFQVDIDRLRVANRV